jgi:hypothetical protein
MVDRTNSANADGDIETGYSDIWEVEMSTNDTTILAELSSSKALSQLLVLKKSDRMTVTATSANNVVTLTQGGLTNEALLIFAAGIKAT